MRAVPHRYICTVALIALQLAAARMSCAGSATWNLNPTTGNWNAASNWTPANVPNGTSDTATFATSNRTSISLSLNTSVAGIVFSAGADAFTITVPSNLALNLGGTGILNNSSNEEIFNLGGRAKLRFLNSASAGSASFYNQAAIGVADGGQTVFNDNSSAGNASFFNSGSMSDHIGGNVYFDHNSSAGTATFINLAGGAKGAISGSVTLSGSSNAGSAHFTNAASPGARSGTTQFAFSASAGTAFFSNEGGEGAGDLGGNTLIAFSATAGNGTFDNYSGTVSGAYGGSTTFRYDFNGHPTAANGTFNNHGGVVSGAHGGFTEFYETATAGNGTFNNNSGTVANTGGGSTNFYGTSTAANGIFNNNGGAVANAGGGTTNFYGTSTAGASTLIANGSAVGPGGGIVFSENSTGGTARAKVFDNGYLAIDSHAFATVLIGSIEGNGTAYSDANNLSVGTNNLATSFSGFIDDSGAGGALTKTGPGVLTFENRADNNYFSDTLTLSIDSGSTINLNFSGTPDTVRSLIIGGVPQMPGLYGSVASGAPNQRAQFVGTGKILVTTFAVSRKMQGANSYDINLPLGGPVGVECRVGENYQIVVTFVSAVSFASASVTSGNGSVGGASGNNSSTVTIDLTGITSPQRIAVTLSGVNDGSTTNDLVIPVGVLVGDTSGNRVVNASDVSQTKFQSGQPINGSNFRQDVSANGVLNGSDVSLVKLHSGEGVSP